MVTTEIALSIEEKAQLNRLEGVIHRGIKTFREVGEALLTIRDERLYREDYVSFTSYCAQRWKMTGTHAHRLIQAHQVMEELEEDLSHDHEVSPKGATLGSWSEGEPVALTSTPPPALPTRETQVRTLGKIPREERADVWRDAVDRSRDGDPSGSEVEQAVARHVVKVGAPGTVEHSKARAQQAKDLRRKVEMQKTEIDGVVSGMENMAEVCSHHRDVLPQHKSEDVEYWIDSLTKSRAKLSSFINRIKGITEV